METLICACCGAKLVPTTTTAFLTCEYCDNSVNNPYYDADAAQEAAKPDFAATALATLREMGVKQNLRAIDVDCFGEPLNNIDSARRAMSIPDGEQVWFLFAHNIFLLGFSDGLALTDTGLYYHCDDGKGSLSWENFISGAISCLDETDGVDGTLKIGSTVTLAVKDEKDSRLVRFLVDFHNQVYLACTGSAAPAAWCVTEHAARAATYTAAQQQADDPSLLDMVLPGLGAILGGASVLGSPSWTTTSRTVAQRTPAMRPTSHPTVRQDRREHTAAPRPLHSQPHHRPASRPAAPAARPASQPAFDTNRPAADKKRPGTQSILHMTGRPGTGKKGPARPAAAPARPAAAPARPASRPASRGTNNNIGGAIPGAGKKGRR